LFHGHGVGVHQVHEGCIDVSGITNNVIQVKVLWIGLVADEDVVERRKYVRVVCDVRIFFGLLSSGDCSLGAGLWLFGTLILRCWRSLLRVLGYGNLELAFISLICFLFHQPGLFLLGTLKSHLLLLFLLEVVPDLLQVILLLPISFLLLLF